MGRRTLLALFALLALALPARAQLGSAPPKVVHWRLGSTVGLGFNELIGGWIAQPYLYIPYGHSKGELFEQANFKVGSNNVISPNVARCGAFVGISPALFLDVNASYWALLDWSAVRFPSMNSRYDTRSRSERHTEFVFGHVFGVNAQFKAAAGKIVLLSGWDFDRWLVPDKYFNIEIGTIIKTGYRLHGQSFLGFMVDDRFIPLLEHEYLRFYGTKYEKESAGVGLLVNNVVPYSSLLGVVAYHLYNPDFQGWKFLIAVVSDFPLEKKAAAKK